MSKRDARNEAIQDLQRKDEEAYKAYASAIREIFDTPEGVIFGRGLIHFLGVQKATPVGKDYALNNMVDNTRREVYFKFIRPYLSASQKTKLEI